MAFLTFSLILDAIITIPAVLIIGLYFYMTRNFNYWKKRGVVQIPPTPFIGNFGKYFTHQKSPSALVKSFYNQAKGLPYVGIYILDKPFLIVRDREIIKKILIKDFNSFSDKLMHSSENDTISNNSIFIISNPAWKFIRNKLTSSFTTGKMKIMFDNLKEVSKDLNDYMDNLQLEGAGKEINIKDIAAKFTTDLIGLATFGIKLKSLKNDDSEFRAFSKMMFGNYTFKRAVELACTWIAPTITNLFGFKFFEETGCNFLKKAFKEIIAEREAMKINRNDFIDLMIQLRNEERKNPGAYDFKFEGDNIISQALAMYIAGYETASAGMSFAFYELARHPEMQTRLRNEINQAIEKNNGQVTYDMVLDLQYLDMIVSETMRMYPNLGIIDRKSTSEYKIEETGLVLEKGTAIFIPGLGLHYDEQYYPNPRVFDPERFSNENKSSIDPAVYLPFGIGPRNCVGMRQGLLQVKLGLIYIISRFEVSLLKNTKVEIDKWSFITASKGGLSLNIRKLEVGEK